DVQFKLRRWAAIEVLRRCAAALALLPADELKRPMDELHAGLAEAYVRAGALAGALRHLKELHRVRTAISDAAVAGRIGGMMLQFDLERARQQEEIFRLRNVELASANAELQALHERLEAKNRELHR